MSLSEFISKSRYMVLIAVLFSLAASFVAFLWGAFKTIKTVKNLAASITGGAGHWAEIGLVAVMDAYLIAIALLVFALALYELFIGEVDLPEWLVIKDLHALKSKLSSVIILIMVVAFLEKLVMWGPAAETLMYAAAITLVTGALIAFSYFGARK